MRIGSFATAQRDVIEMVLRSSFGIDPSRRFCIQCLDALELRIEARQIVRDDEGRAFFVDLMLAPYPILPTPMRLEAASDFTGRGTTICFIDSGFIPHPDFLFPEKRLEAFYDAVRCRKLSTGPPRSEPAIAAWHGTMTAASAAGSGHLSGALYRGIASDAKVVFVSTMSPQGAIGTKSIVSALRWVLRNYKRYSINIVSISVGADEIAASRSHPVLRLIDDLVTEGVVVVAAAGNGPDRPLMPPASAPAAITVGGYDDRNTTDRSHWRLWYGSHGVSVTGEYKPELLAPSNLLAAPILPNTAVKREAEALFAMAVSDDASMMKLIKRHASSTHVASLLTSVHSPRLLRSIIHRRMNDEKIITPSYKHVDGTSFAAPLTSSIIAQMLEANPALTPTRVREILVATAQRLPNVPFEKQGAGVIQARAAVEMARAS
ncbi:MAG: S8 family serine peptidase [bacterium]|nr:S8 family serine peptidase [Candidatus Kapabacteria bacterium]